MDSMLSYKTKVDIPDIDKSKTFDESIQYIFFRMLSNLLRSYDSFVEGQSFDFDGFVDSFDKTEYKDFVDNLVNTNAFESFVLTSNDSYEKLTKKTFQNIRFIVTS